MFVMFSPLSHVDKFRTGLTCEVEKCLFLLYPFDVAVLSLNLRREAAFILTPVTKYLDGNFQRLIARTPVFTAANKTLPE